MLQRILIPAMFFWLLLPFSGEAQSLAYAQLGFKRVDITQAPSLEFDSFLLPSVEGKPEASVFRSPDQLPLVWSYEDLAAFCKLDVQLDRIAPLNIRFRLGEVSYVDRLEKKGPTRPDYRR